MSLDGLQSKLGPTLVDFSKDGAYPEEEAVAAAYVEKSAFPLALKFLGDAKAELEVSPDCSCQPRLELHADCNCRKRYAT